MTAALTTTFSPPSQCTTDIWKMRWDADHDYFLLGGGDYTSCLPNSFKPESGFFYTPGLHCPDGYSAGSSTTSEVGAETISIVICCPSGYTVEYPGFHTAFPWENTLGCASACTGTEAFSFVESSTTISTTCTTGAVNAYSVQLRFRDADMSTTISSSIPPPTNTPSPNSGPTSILPTNSATSGISATHNTGLSADAKAGIGIGSIFGVALVGALVYLAWNIRRRTNIGKQGQDYDQPEWVSPNAEPNSADSRTIEGNVMSYAQLGPDTQRHELGYELG